MKAPLPSNETARLEVLEKYEILDTASESAFDDLTRLAAYTCGVPTAIISLDVATQKATQYGREADLTLNIACAGVKIAEQDLRKIGEEIIDNAFKFSEAGATVQIRATVDNDIFQLTIANSGCAMTLEQIASIGACRQFEREFYVQQGLGLGLVIAKRLTELHNGQVNNRNYKNCANYYCVY